MPVNLSIKNVPDATPQSSKNARRAITARCRKSYMRNTKTVNELTDITSDTQYNTLASQEVKLLNKVGMGSRKKRCEVKPVR
jgi:hypothetical protein